MHEPSSLSSDTDDGWSKAIQPEIVAKVEGFGLKPFLRKDKQQP
jgi:hypothetical protein